MQMHLSRSPVSVTIVSNALSVLTFILLSARRDAAAANARKGNARKSLAEVTDDVKKLGWDPRILQRAMKKAQLVLDVDDETLKNAQELSTRLVRSQEIDQRLSDALAEVRDNGLHYEILHNDSQVSSFVCVC